MPTISRVWERSEKPCSEAIAEVQRLDGRPLDLDRGAARTAHQVMVVGVRAAAVDRLAVLAAEDVDEAVVGVQRERPVDRREADAGAPRREQLVHLLAPTGSRRPPLARRGRPGAVESVRGQAQCSS